MSIVLRSLLGQPEVSRWDRRYSANPLTRALRTLEDDLYDLRRDQIWNPYAVNEFADAVDRIQNLTQEIDQIARESGAGRLVGRALASGDMVMKRAGDGSFQLALDVADYKPEDIKINLVDDHLVIEAKNESSGENSYHKSEFKRWFKLPENCKLGEIKSNLTKDNKLLISLPSTEPAVEPKVRSIPINIDNHEPIEQPKEPAKKKDDQSKQNSTQTKSK